MHCTPWTCSSKKCARTSEQTAPWRRVDKVLRRELLKLRVLRGEVDAGLNLLRLERFGEVRPRRCGDLGRLDLEVLRENLRAFGRVRARPIGRVAHRLREQRDRALMFAGPVRRREPARDEKRIRD